MLTVGSFCSGYGGLDLAVEAHYGAATVWQSEIEKDCVKVLAHHWPGVPNLGDLTTIDWDDVEPVDIICAGFPCQPFSTAGHRLGEEDDRAIFHYIADAIRILRPGRVVLENVSAITSLGGPGVIGTLTGLGYDCRWGLVRASDAGAAHRRARWFCVATNPGGERHGGGQDSRVVGRVGASPEVVGGQEGGPREKPVDRNPTSAADADESGPQGHRGEHGLRGACGDSADPSEDHDDSPGGERGEGEGGVEALLPTPTVNDAHNRNPAPSQFDRNSLALPALMALLPTPVAWDHKSHGPNMDWQKRADKHVDSTAAVLMLMRQAGQQNWGKYEAAIARWAALTRLPGAPTDERGLLPEFVEWLMGLPAGWVCDLGLKRSPELKMLGNGVVPQQAMLALHILDGD